MYVCTFACSECINEPTTNVYSTTSPRRVRGSARWMRRGKPRGPPGFLGMCIGLKISSNSIFFNYVNVIDLERELHIEEELRCFLQRCNIY